MFIITAGIVLMAFILAYIILKLNEAGAEKLVPNQTVWIQEVNAKGERYWKKVKGGGIDIINFT